MPTVASQQRLSEMNMERRGMSPIIITFLTIHVAPSCLQSCHNRISRQKRLQCPYLHLASHHNISCLLLLVFKNSGWRMILQRQKMPVWSKITFSELECLRLVRPLSVCCLSFCVCVCVCYGRITNPLLVRSCDSHTFPTFLL